MHTPSQGNSLNQNSNQKMYVPELKDRTNKLNTLIGDILTYRRVTRDLRRFHTKGQELNVTCVMEVLVQMIQKSRVTFTWVGQNND